MINSGRRVGINPLFSICQKKEACMSKITEQVEALIQPVLNDLNFELVDIEYVKEGKDHF